MDKIFSEKEILQLYKEGQITETEYNKLNSAARKPISSSPQGYTPSKPNKELSFAFWRYVVPGGIIFILSPFSHRNSFGDWTVGVAILLTWILYSLWSWKNKRELFKRWVLALLFASLTVVLVGLTVFKFSDSWTSGMLMFIVLTGGEENSKQFFVVRLIIGIVLIALFCVLVSLIKSGLTPP